MKVLLFALIAVISLVVLYFALRLYKIYRQNNQHKSKDETDGMYLLVSDKRHKE